MADTEIIPVIDLGPYLAGTPGAIDRYYTDYMIRDQQRTYNVFGTENKNAAE